MTKPMATGVVRRWGRSLGVVIPKEETLRKGIREGHRVRIVVDPLPGPDDFADLFGTAKWKRSAQDYKDELRRMRGD